MTPVREPVAVYLCRHNHRVLVTRRHARARHPSGDFRVLDLVWYDATRASHSFRGTECVCGTDMFKRRARVAYPMSTLAAAHALGGDGAVMEMLSERTNYGRVPFGREFDVRGPFMWPELMGDLP